jgi:hypothetical protein
MIGIEAGDLWEEGLFASCPRDYFSHRMLIYAPRRMSELAVKGWSKAVECSILNSILRLELCHILEIRVVVAAASRLGLRT